MRVRGIIACKSFFTVVLMEMKDRNAVLSTYKVSPEKMKGYEGFEGERLNKLDL